MSLSIEILGPATAVPLIVAVAVVWLGRRVLPAAASERFAAAAAVGLAFFSGHACLSWTALWPPLSPDRLWLPWLGLAAVPAALAAERGGQLTRTSWRVCLALAMAAALLLVPTWPDLPLGRPLSLVLVTAYLFALVALLDRLAARLAGHVVPVACAVAAAALGIMLAASVSVKFGELAWIAAVALAGSVLAGGLGPSGIATRGVIPVYAVLVGGTAYLGCIEPQPPLPALLIAPAVYAAAVLVPLAIAWAWLELSN
jgi:hypothetical protein